MWLSEYALWWSVKSYGGRTWAQFPALQSDNPQALELGSVT